MLKPAILILTAALGCVALDARAETPASAAVAPAQVEPAAVAALTRMSAYLRSIPAFQVTLQTQRDDVDVYGQLITLSGKAVYKARRPDALSIELAMPSMAGRYVYDGKTMTIYDATSGSYAKSPAPSTIRAALEQAERTYAFTAPLQDLFTWSEGDARAKALTSAHFVGKAQIGGQSASHYAFRQQRVDWQIWIADGDKPTPLRVSLVARDDPERPQFEADLSWDTAPQFAAGEFDYTPPANAKLASVQPIH